VTYNSERHIPDLVQSLKAQTLRDFELIHIDSASSDESPDLLKRSFPMARVICAKENLGYRKGNQKGIDLALGKYILVLNDDVELHPFLLERLVIVAERDERIALVAPAILLHGSGMILNAAGSDLAPNGFYAARAKRHPLDAFQKQAEVAAASGCCFLVRRSFIHSHGGFDSVFDSLATEWHASAEDLDLSWKAWTSGRRVVYEPRAILWHKYQQKPITPGRFASLISGRLAFVLMNYSRSTLLRFSPLLLMTELGLLAYSMMRGPSYLHAWLQSWRWAWRNRRRLAELRAKRASIRRANDASLFRHMKPALILAPEMRRNPLSLIGSFVCAGLNALCLVKTS